jgi:hypothetical protein
VECAALLACAGRVPSDLRVPDEQDCNGHPDAAAADRLAHHRLLSPLSLHWRLLALWPFLSSLTLL